MSPKGARRALARHPWIYRGDVVSVPAHMSNGGIVRVIDNRGRPLGRATWSERSQIALRFVRWEDEPVDDAFWAARLEAAIGMSGIRFGQEYARTITRTRDALTRRRESGSEAPEETF